MGLWGVPEVLWGQEVEPVRAVWLLPVPGEPLPAWPELPAEMPEAEAEEA